MASLTPATVIGLQREIGSIEPGKRADLCVMDSAFRVQRTICGGETVYDASRPPGVADRRPPPTP